MAAQQTQLVQVGRDHAHPGQQLRDERTHGVGGHEHVATGGDHDRVQHHMGHRVAAQGAGHHGHHLGVVQHADFDGVGTHVAQYGVNLLGQKRGGQGVDAAHAHGVLRGDGGNGGGAKAAQGGKSFEVGLDTCAPARV